MPLCFLLYYITSRPATRGWWRHQDHWQRRLDVTKQRPRGAHLNKALQDPKYRTRLCSHWENSKVRKAAPASVIRQAVRASVLEVGSKGGEASVGGYLKSARIAPSFIVRIVGMEPYSVDNTSMRC